MVVAEVARDDRELEPRAPAGGVGQAADRVGVDVAYGLVEGLRAERLVRAPEAEERGRRAQELESCGRHLVGQLGVGELGEEGERPAAGRPTGSDADGAGGAQRPPGAGA